MTGPWLRALSDLERDGEPAVLITVVTARGSTPRESGCKMVVTARTQYDTIGGGSLEFTCVEAARTMLIGTTGPVLREFPLGPALGQCCGGHVSVLFEPLRPSHLPVALFGAGHVGRALVGLLAPLRLRVTWIDTRADALADAPSGIDARHTANPAREVATLPSGTLVLVMTHDHQIDFDIVAAALPRADFAGVGWGCVDCTGGFAVDITLDRMRTLEDGMRWTMHMLSKDWMQHPIALQGWLASMQGIFGRETELWAKGEL